MKHGKKYIESKKSIDNLRLYDPREGLEALADYIGVPLKDLPIKENILVAAIVRKGQTIIPNGFDEIHKGDSVVVITSEMASLEELDDIMR